MARRKGGAGVEIFRTVESGPGKGLKVTTAVAVHEETRAAVASHAKRVGKEASSILVAHRESGDAYIEVVDDTATQVESSNGKNYKFTDKIVVLNDERGFGAAMTIEYGMGPGIDDEGYFYPGTDAVAPLRRAAGLPFVIHRTGKPHRRLPNKRSRRWKLE